MALLVVAALAVGLTLSELDGLLARLQAEGRGAYTLADFGPINPTGLPATVEDLLKVWNTADPIADVAAYWHIGIDAILFVPLYGLLLFALLTSARDALPAESPIRATGAVCMALLVAMVLADEVENGLRAFMIWQDSAAPALVNVAWLATMVKWGMLALLLGWLGAAVAAGVRPAGPPARRALWRFRLPLFLVGAWSAFLLFDPTGQAHDLLRRWLDDPVELLRVAGALLAAAALGFAVWTTGRRVFLWPANPSDTALPWWALLGTAAVLGLVSLIDPLANLRAAAIVLLVVSALGLLSRLADEPAGGPADRAATAAVPTGAELTALQSVAAGLAVVPLMALLLAAGAAMVVPAVVLLAGDDFDRLRGLLAVAIAVVAPAAALAVCAFGPPFLRRFDGVATGAFEIRHAVVVGAALAVAVVAVWAPLDFPPVVGPLVIVATAFVLVLALLGEGQRFGESHRPPVGLGAFGFVRVPVIGLVAATFVVASLLEDGSYHDVHRNDERTPSASGVKLAAAWTTWKARNCVSARRPQAEVPLVLIANYGGGLRAAYWSGSVLSSLLDAAQPVAGSCRRPAARRADRVFAISGISGGALGLLSWRGHASRPAGDEWWKEALGRRDYLSVPVSWGLLVDLPRTFVGWNPPDRARRLEEAWEQGIDGLDEDYFAKRRDLPLTLLGGTQVDTGCRVNVAVVRLSSPPSERTGCGAVAERSAASPLVTAAGTYRVPDAALTTEILDRLCDGGSLARSTAAHLSARFPYVSPSGRLPGCAGGDATAVVDGGYAEGSGGQALLDLWHRLEPLVRAHNERGRGAKVVPVFVQVDNHYGKAVSAGPSGRTEELIVPPATAGRPDALDALGTEQLANATFSTDLPGLPGTTCMLGSGDGQRFVRIAPPESPGVPAPLAWTLSRMATDELDSQRERALEKPPVRNLISLMDRKDTQLCTEGAR